MSVINDEHADFLSGKSNQIQAFDLVRSKKVDKNTKLELYDVVLYNNPYVGTDMHRIVGIVEDRADEVFLSKNTFETIDNVPGFILSEVDSRIYTNAMSSTGMELDILTSEATYNDGYYFNFGGKNIEPTVTTYPYFNKYIHHLVLTRESTRPVIINMTHKLEFDYNDHLLFNIKYHSYYGDINLYKEGFTLNEDNEYEMRTNISYKYEIRGDKAKDSDGLFSIDDIYSKVVQVIPKAGYVVKYVSSTYGIIMFIGIAFVIIGTQFALDFIDKKEKKKLAEGETSNEEK